MPSVAAILNLIVHRTPALRQHDTPPSIFQRSYFMRFVSTFVGMLAVALASATNDVQAASVQTLNNPVPNGYIKIDGNINDWLSIPRYNPDPVGDGSSGGARPLDIDILQGGIAHDENFFYVLYRNAGDNMVDQFSNWVFFDLDQNQATGYKATPELASIGMEFNTGGLVGWNNFDAGGPFLGGAAGLTVAAGDSDGSGGTDFIEWAISRTAVQPNGGTFNPTGTSLNVVFGAEDTVLDTSPNNGAADWFTYDASGVYDPGVPGDADGNGTINIADYQLIQANSFTVVNLGTLGDVDDSGFVDFADFQQWKTNFPGGVAAAEAAIAALPEPSAAALSVCGLCAILSVSRRRMSNALRAK
jgi:hypothetical protein